MCLASRSIECGLHKGLDVSNGTEACHSLPVGCFCSSYLLLHADSYWQTGKLTDLSVLGNQPAVLRDMYVYLFVSKFCQKKKQGRYSGSEEV